MKKSLLLLLTALLLVSFLYAQDKTNDQKSEQAKTGLNIGAIPVIAFDSDLGLQYGALANLYLYGDGSQYPQYRHSFYFEVSRFTKGSGINRFFYDSKYLIKNIRVTGDISYLTEQALDFYGFNGYSSLFNSAWSDSENADYKSRMFYRHSRNRFRMLLDFQGKLKYDNLRWIAGVASFNDKIESVDIDKLNKDKDEADLLPTVEEMPGLYERYIEWDLIPDAEKEGGRTNYFKLGVVYDTRDNEPNPMKGIWTEAVIFTAPSFFGNDFSHTKLSITHRQYFTLIEKDLSFAYRLGYQGTIGGHTPFYIQPNLVTSFLKSANSDGLGGSKTIRGVLRNRVVGDGVAYGNLELRWKFLHTILLKQNIYLGINVFFDSGMVVNEIDVDETVVNDNVDYFSGDKDSLHNSIGGGFRFAMNQNFIIAVDYGVPLKKQDGSGGLYIGLNYLF